MQVIVAVVIEHQRLPELQGAPPALCRLVDACTDPRPEHRPTFARVAATLRQLRAEQPAA
jgi:hypothetical protein